MLAASNIPVKYNTGCDLWHWLEHLLGVHKTHPAKEESANKANQWISVTAYSNRHLSVSSRQNSQLYIAVEYC